MASAGPTSSGRTRKIARITPNELIKLIPTNSNWNEKIFIYVSLFLFIRYDFKSWFGFVRMHECERICLKWLCWCVNELIWLKIVFKTALFIARLSISKKQIPELCK